MLKKIKCPKCRCSGAILDTETGSIECGYCMYQEVPKKPLNELTNKELENWIYETIHETRDIKTLKKLLLERNRRSEEE